MSPGTFTTNPKPLLGRPPGSAGMHHPSLGESSPSNSTRAKRLAEALHTLSHIDMADKQEPSQKQKRWIGAKKIFSEPASCKKALEKNLSALDYPRSRILNNSGLLAKKTRPKCMVIATSYCLWQLAPRASPARKHEPLQVYTAQSKLLNLSPKPNHPTWGRHGIMLDLTGSNEMSWYVGTGAYRGHQLAVM